MSGIRFLFEASGLYEAETRLSRLTDLDGGTFLDTMGALIVSQTQRRITSEKTAPDGTPWKENSQKTETLVESGQLRDSIDHVVSGDQVEVGSSKIYAAVHQMGAIIVPVEMSHLVFNLGGRTIFAKQVTIPARPYLGLSSQNQWELQAVAESMLEDLIR